MLKGTAARILIGDPTLIVCDGFLPAPFSVETAEEGRTLHVIAKVTNPDLKSTFTDTFYNDLNPQVPFNDRALLVVKLPDETDQSGVSHFGYDDVGNLISNIDPLNNTTRYTYDALNHIANETDARNKVTSYQYNAVGDLEGVTDRNGRRRSYEHDEPNRQTRENWFDAAQQPIVSIASTHDANRRLTSIGDARSTLAYTYDAMDHITSESSTSDLGTVLLNYRFGWQYDQCYRSNQWRTERNGYLLF